MRFVYTLTFLLASGVVWAQKDKGNWHKGQIQLKNGRSLKGFVLYNDKHATIQFREALTVPLKDAESFNEGSVAIMEFFNEETKTNHRFYSLNTQSEETGFKGQVLFEVLAEFSNGAVLKYRTQQMLLGKDDSMLNDLAGKGEITGQFEGYFCLSENGKAEWFLIYALFERNDLLPIQNIFDNPFFLDKKNDARKYKNEVIKKFLGAHWKQVDSYAKENKLKFSRQDDIAPLLTYYKQLLEGK